MEKYPLRRRMVAEWGLVIDGVFVPWTLLEGLADQAPWDSEAGDVLRIDNGDVARVLSDRNLAVHETRGGYHRGDNLRELLDSYTEEDWRKSPEDMLLLRLNELHASAGAPSSRNIADAVTAAGKKISHTTANNTLKGHKFPSWGVLEGIVLYLKGDPLEFHDLWKNARGERRMK